MVKFNIATGASTRVTAPTPPAGGRVVSPIYVGTDTLRLWEYDPQGASGLLTYNMATPGFTVGTYGGTPDRVQNNANEHLRVDSNIWVLSARVGVPTFRDRFLSLLNVNTLTWTARVPWPSKYDQTLTVWDRVGSSVFSFSATAVERIDVTTRAITSTPWSPPGAPLTCAAYDTKIAVFFGSAVPNFVIYDTITGTFTTHAIPGANWRLAKMGFRGVWVTSFGSPAHVAFVDMVNPGGAVQSKTQSNWGPTTARVIGNNYWVVSFRGSPATTAYVHRFSATPPEPPVPTRGYRGIGLVRGSRG